MDKRKLMQNNVASILNTPAPMVAPVKGGAAPSSGFETRGRRRRPRNEKELAAMRNSVEAWDKTKSYTTSFVFDYDQYLEMESIANEHRISKKAALKELLRLGIEEYRRKGGF